MQRVRIVTAEERMSAANNKTSLAIFGLPGVGKTTLLKTLPADRTVCLDLEAGMKSVQDWPGASIPVRSFTDFRDLAVLIGGPDPAADPNAYYSERHYQHVRSVYAGSGIEEFLAAKSIVFVNSITDLTRQAMAFARQQPEAFSERTGKPDVRGAYGLLGREVIQALKHLQHAPGKTVIFVGVLEKVTDDLNTTTWQPQMEGGKASRELPGIVDQVISMHLFSRDPGRHLRQDPHDHPRRRRRRLGADGQGAVEGVSDERRQDARLRVHRPRGAVRQAQVLAELHGGRRQGRRQGLL